MINIVTYYYLSIYLSIIIYDLYSYILLSIYLLLDMTYIVTYYYIYIYIYYIWPIILVIDNNYYMINISYRDNNYY